MGNRANSGGHTSGKPKSSTRRKDRSSQPTPSAEALVSGALSAAEDHDISVDEITDGTLPEISKEDLSLSAELYRLATEKCSDAEKRFNRRLEELDERDKRQVELSEAIREKEQKHRETWKEIQDRLKEADRRQREILDKHIQLEADKSNFIEDSCEQVYQTALAPLVERRKKILEDAVTEKLALDEREVRINESQRTIESRERQVLLQHQLLEEERADWESQQRVEENETVEEYRLLLEVEQRRLNSAHSENKRLQQIEESYEDLRRTLGSDPARLTRDLELLRDRNVELEKELQARPDAIVGEELQLAQAELLQIRKDNLSLRGDNQQLKSELSATQLSALELDTVKREKATLDAGIAACLKRIDEETARYERLTKKTAEQPPFPECTAMDSRLSLQVSRPISNNEGIDLKSLTLFLPEIGRAHD